MSKIVILGGVAGGMSAAARLRRLDESAEIVVLEKGEYISYANCGLPYYIGGMIKEREKLLVQTEASFENRFNVDIRQRSEVVKIDRKNKTVLIKDLSKDREYNEKYDKLILSPGAEPIRPPLPGIDHPRIFTLRNIPDTDRIKSFIDDKNPGHALIIGAGFIGLEMAENLHRQGIFVTIVEMAKQVMNVLDFEMAALVHQRLKEKKIEFYLDDAVESFEDSSGRVRVKLKSGKETIVDMVILSIGVRPDTRLAKDAGLELGDRGGIAVNDYMQTSDKDIYAVGDAVEILNPVLGKKVIVPLAWPANKQGRIAADNIAGGNKIKYKGTIATAIAKVFDLTVGVTGATEKQLISENIPYLLTIVHPFSHASYYPDALQMSIKLLFSPEDGTVLGAQAVGYDGVDKRLDVIAAAIWNNNTVYDLTEFEHAYAPPYSSAKDPLNMAAFTAENILNNKVKVVTWDKIDSLNPSETIFLDVRTPEEINFGKIKDAVDIPVDELRSRFKELPKKKKIVVYCRVGLRGYIASRILTQTGFTEVYNLTGGYLTYSAAAGKQDNPDSYNEAGLKKT